MLRYLFKPGFMQRSIAYPFQVIYKVYYFIFNIQVIIYFKNEYLFKNRWFFLLMGTGLLTRGVSRITPNHRQIGDLGRHFLPSPLKDFLPLGYNRQGRVEYLIITKGRIVFGVCPLCPQWIRLDTPMELTILVII